MMGSRHALLGLSLCLGAGLTATAVADMHPADLALFAVLGAGFSVANDLDHPDSGVTRSMGPLTRRLSRVVAWLSGGHRNGTHSFFGSGVFALLGFASAAVYAADWRLLGAGATFAAALALIGRLCAIRLNRGKRPKRAYAERWRAWAAGGVVAALLALIGVAGILWGRDAGAWLVGFWIALSLSALLRAWMPIKWALHRIKAFAGLADDLLPYAVAYLLVTSNLDLTVVPWALAAGLLAHLAGDSPTMLGCPLGWPWSQENVSTPWTFRVNDPIEVKLGWAFGIASAVLAFLQFGGMELVSGATL